MSNNNTILVMDCIDEGEDKFDNLELMRGFYDEIKKNPNGVLEVIARHIDWAEEDLVEKGICPDCGTEMEFEYDGCDTYVPYGSTSVCFAKGGYMRCPHCGFKAED